MPSKTFEVGMTPVFVARSGRRLRVITRGPILHLPFIQQCDTHVLHLR